MSRGAGLRKVAGGVAKREREEWARLAAGWTCQVRGCEEAGVAVIRDWTGAGRPICGGCVEQARVYGLVPIYPPQQQGASS